MDSTSMGQYGVRRVARHRERKHAMSSRLPLNLDQFKLIPKVWLTAKLSYCLCKHVLATSFVARAGSLPCFVYGGIGDALPASWQSFGGKNNPELCATTSLLS